MGAQQAKLGVDTRTSSPLGTPPSSEFEQCYYPFAIEDGEGRLAPMADEFIHRFIIGNVSECSMFSKLGCCGLSLFRSKSFTLMQEFVRRCTLVPFRRFLAYMRREFMQRVSVVLHGTLGRPNLRDALHEGGACVVACLNAPRAYASLLIFPLHCWWIPLFAC
jgi:hypothetical protein